jgi:aryl-alcohol dehydrogenase-like predicted oxidoreductase
MLTGKYNKEVPSDSRLALFSKKDGYIASLLKQLGEAEGKAKIAKVDKLMVVAEGLGCTVAQLALAWCIKNPNVSSVIVGASKVSQLLENMEAVAVSAKITPEVMMKIDMILGNAPKLPADRM